MFDLAETIRRACVLEATAAKPGNVHPQASFADLTYLDFVRSADAVAPVLARTAELGVGRAVFEAIQATQAVVRSNTNLGIVLLLAPLAAVPLDRSLQDGIGDVLQRLTRDDAVWVYRAIRLAQPGGLGSAANEDVAHEPTGTLLDVMTLAADRDGVAAQYATNFSWVLNEGDARRLGLRPDRPERFDDTGPVGTESQPTLCEEPAIIELQLRLLAAHPDTLIARKCGRQVAEEASRKAREILESGGPRTESGSRLLTDFDRWLREDGHRRNPGTTADLITACLFAAIRDSIRQ